LNKFRAEWFSSDLFFFFFFTGQAALLRRAGQDTLKTANKVLPALEKTFLQSCLRYFTSNQFFLLAQLI
jgi:hypothetical protein